MATDPVSELLSQNTLSARSIPWVRRLLEPRDHLAGDHVPGRQAHGVRGRDGRVSTLLRSFERPMGWPCAVPGNSPGTRNQVGSPQRPISRRRSSRRRLTTPVTFRGFYVTGISAATNGLGRDEL